MAEGTPHILSIDVDLALSHAREQLQEFHEEASGKPAVIPVTTSGGAGGAIPPSRTAIGAPSPGEDPQEQAARQAAISRISSLPANQPQSLSVSQLEQQLRSTYLQQIQRGDIPGANRTLGQITTYGMSPSGLPSASEFADEQRRQLIGERYDTKYENRLASDAARDQLAKERVGQRVDRNFDSAALAGQRADERRGQQVNEAFDRAALAAQKAEERRAAAIEKQAEKEEQNLRKAIERSAETEKIRGDRLAGNQQAASRRLGQTNFQAELAGMKPEDRIEAINQRIGGGNLDPLEEAQLTKQRNTLQYAEDNRGLLRMRLFGAAYFAYRGISAAVTEYEKNQDAQRTLQQQGGDAYLEAEKQRYEERGVSHYVRAGAAAFERFEAWAGDLVGTDASKRNAERRRRRADDLDDDVAQQAIVNAQDARKLELAKVDIGADATQQQRRREQMEQSALNMGVSDPLRRAQYEATNQYIQAQQREADKVTALNARIAAESNPAQKAILQAQLEEAQKQGPLNIAAARTVYDATNTEIGRTASIQAGAIGFANQALRYSQEGRTELSSFAAVLARFNPTFDKSGNLIAIGDIEQGDTRFQNTKEAYDLAVQQSLIEERQRQDIRGGLNASMTDTLNRKPLQSQIDEINAARKAALEGPNGQPINPTSQRAIEANEEYDNRIKVAQMQDADQRRMAVLGLNTERAQLSALRANPTDQEGAAIAGILGQGLQRAASLYNAEHPEVAKEALDNSRLRLDVEKQDYLRSFRGQQIDFRLQGISDRDQTDVGKTMKDFAEAAQKIIDFGNNLPTLVTDAITAAIGNVATN